MFGLILHIVTDDSNVAKCGKQTKGKDSGHTIFACEKCLRLSVGDRNDLASKYNDLVEKHDTMTDRLNLIGVVADPRRAVDLCRDDENDGAILAALVGEPDSGE